MKILHLNLKRKWFDMILSGEKKEEYRGLSKYWTVRLRDKHTNTWISYDTITFSNGYAKDRDQFVIEHLGTSIGHGKPKWGAECKEYYILKLGRIKCT